MIYTYENILYGGVNMNFKEKIRVIEGFPKEGISFKDITTLIADGEGLKASIDGMVEKSDRSHVVL